MIIIFFMFVVFQPTFWVWLRALRASQQPVVRKSFCFFRFRSGFSRKDAKPPRRKTRSDSVCLFQLCAFASWREYLFIFIDPNV